MANPNTLAPKIDTTVVIVTGTAQASGFSAPMFVSEFASSVSFPTRIKSYAGSRDEKSALMLADGFATTSSAYRQMRAAMDQDGPPATIYIGRRDPGDADWGTALDAIYSENSDDWYWMAVDARSSADIQQINAWVQPVGGDPKFAAYLAQTSSAQVLAGTAGNFAGVIAALGGQRTALVWHDPATASGYGPASVVSRPGTFAFGASESLTFRFDGGATQSFAFAAAPAVKTGSIAGTYNLSAGGSLALAANGAAAQTVTLTSVSAAVRAAAIETYALSAGDTLAVRVDGGASQTVTVDAGPAETLGTETEPFVITAAWQLSLSINGGGSQVFVFAGTETTAQHLADLINATAVGVVASDDTGALLLTTVAEGTDASIEIEAASTAGLLTEIGMAIGTDNGTGDVGDISAVTAAELAAVATADLTGATGSDDGGYLLITADSSGTASRIQVVGGAINDAIQAATDEQSGSGNFANGLLATTAEVVNAINAQIAGMTASVSTNFVRLTSDQLGTGSSVGVSAGAVATLLGLAATVVSGTGDFDNAAAASASEIQIVIGATIVSGSVSAPGGTVKLSSATSGSTSTVEILTDSVGLTWSGDGYAVGTGTDEDYLDAAWIGRCSTFNLDGRNGAALWDNQSLTNIEPDVLSVAQKASLDSRRVNAYYANAGRAETHWGVMLKQTGPTDSILYIDELTTADWLDARVSEAFNRLLNSYADAKAKIRYDVAGQLLGEAFRSVLKTSDRNGHTVYDGSPLDLLDDQDTGVYIPGLINQSQDDINTRRFAGLRARQNYQSGVQRVANLIELQRPPVQL